MDAFLGLHMLIRLRPNLAVAITPGRSSTGIVDLQQWTTAKKKHLKLIHWGLLLQHWSQWEQDPVLDAECSDSLVWNALLTKSVWSALEGAKTVVGGDEAIITGGVAKVDNMGRDRADKYMERQSCEGPQRLRTNSFNLNLWKDLQWGRRVRKVGR